jgi:hypothetical protein
MSETTYTITINEAERISLAYTLGLLVAKFTNAKLQIDESPSGGTQSARAVLSPPSQAPAAAPSPTPVEPRDRWARDRKGNEVTNPEGCVSREVIIWKAEVTPGKKDAKKPFLKVTWQSQDRGYGYVDANCFDEKLFPWIIKQKGEKTTLYIVKSGEYLNVVGVRA